MKMYFLGGLFLTCSLSCQNLVAQEKGQSVYLHGMLKNFSKQVTIEDMSEMDALQLPDPKRTFITDSNGHFSVTFDVGEANYFRIGRNTLFLSPGDSLEVFFDRNNPVTASFKGDHSKENEYLRTTPFPAAGSFLEAGDSLKHTITATIQSVFEAAEKRQDALKNIAGISKEFRRFENARVKADLVNSLVSINIYYPGLDRLTNDSLQIFRKTCENEIKPFIKEQARNLISPEFLKLRVYRDIVPWLLYYKIIDTVAFFEDWRNAKSLVHKIKSVKDSSITVEFAADLKSIKSVKYRSALSRTFNQLVELNGMKALDFKMSDRKDSLIALSSFKGKVIFIDIWATWCGPCIGEQPHLDSLRRFYQQNDEIVFISLAIDSDRQTWKNWLIEKDLKGEQFIIARNELEGYHLAEIPRTIIIDKNFRISALRGPQPSENETISILNSILTL